MGDKREGRKGGASDEEEGQPLYNNRKELIGYLRRG
eukprot:gene5677-21404_t